MFWDRLITNWKTTVAAIMAGAVAVAAWLGFDLDPAPIAALLAAVEGIILMFFARD